MPSNSSAASVARRKVAANVPRLSFAAIESFVSFGKPCSLSRSANLADTNGAPVCPHCGGVDAYECRRPNGSLRFRCRACAKDFTLTSGTLFASHKLPLRMYLAAIAIFYKPHTRGEAGCNEVKGKSALAISRDLGLAYKSAFVLLRKLREAMAGEFKNRMIGGEGKTAEVDGGFFGGYVKP